MNEVANNLLGIAFTDVVERLYIKSTNDFFDRVPNVELNPKISDI
jgi:hypothetical protein